MAVNDYYDNTLNKILPATSADASDVEDKCDEIAQAFTDVETDMDKKISLSNADNTNRDIPDAVGVRTNKMIGFDSAGEFGLQVRRGTFKGNWTATTYFYQDDLVHDSADALGEGVDAVFVCTVNHTSSADLVTDTANWSLMLSTGDIDAAIALKYDKTGGTISGNVLVDGGLTVDNGGFAIKSAGITDVPMYIQRSTGATAMKFWWENDVEEVHLEQYSYSDALETKLTLADGNAKLSGNTGNTPTDPSHLTRKDYVDSKVTHIDSSIAISTDGTNLANDDGSANKNVAIGNGVLIEATTGYKNIGIGEDAVGQCTTGYLNIGIGDKATRGGTGFSGRANIGIGGSAAQSLTTGEYNTCIGYSAGTFLTSGDSNVLIGNTCGGTGTGTGSHNIGMGYFTLRDLSGDHNTAIGTFSSAYNTGTRNTGLGAYAGSYTTKDGSTYTLAVDDAIAIGYRAYVTANGEMSLGNEDYITSAFSAVSISVRSDERLKDMEDIDLGLDFINAITPKKYKWIEGADKESVNYGFSAQEVKAALDERIGNVPSTMHKMRDDIHNLTYTEFVAPLVKSVQELTAMNEALLARIEALESK